MKTKRLLLLAKELFRKRFFLLIIGLLVIFFVDRYAVMPKRLKGTWEFQKGAYIRDPIVYKQHFYLEGNKIVFKSGEKFLLLGCYFGQLFLYDPTYGDVTRYSKF